VSGCDRVIDLLFFAFFSEQIKEGAVRVVVDQFVQLYEDDNDDASAALIKLVFQVLRTFWTRSIFQRDFVLLVAAFGNPSEKKRGKNTSLGVLLFGLIQACVPTLSPADIDVFERDHEEVIQDVQSCFESVCFLVVVPNLEVVKIE